jgi:CTP synthase
VTDWKDISGRIESRDDNANLGGTMRLGEQKCNLKIDSLAYKVYNKSSTIFERHRHRYEVNNSYIHSLEKNGLIISGLSDGSERLVEIVELEDHPWFLACQFHPEFTSNPRDGHFLFTSFINAAINFSRR